MVDVVRMLEPLALGGERSSIRRAIAYAARGSGNFRRDHAGRISLRPDDPNVSRLRAMLANREAHP